ncbi:DNA repair protein rad52 [Coemansia sp. RSA 2599]|nr:DNA repair protein rad52 [Coemansia sp. RSA 2599]
MSHFSSTQTKADSEHQHGATAFAFDAEETMRMQSLLRKKLGPEHISTRQGMGGSRLSYIEGWRIISIANEVFGFNGWRSSIQNLTIDFMDMTEGGRFNVGASCVVRITLRDGTYREDVGYGMIENTKSKGQALEKVKKEATTDALKRAMRQFGNVLGNCVYDKEYVKSLMQVQKQSRGRIQGDNLYSHQHSISNSSNSRFSHRLYHLPMYHRDRPGIQKTRLNDALSGRATMPLALAYVGESSDFDMDELDDDGMLDMIEDLETDRPIIHDSPSSFGFSRASNAQQLTTPIRSNMANGGSAPASAASANAGVHGSGGQSAGIGAANPASRNLNAQLASTNEHQQYQHQASRAHSASPNSASAPITGAGANRADSSANAALAAERPRSFADITSFVPTSQSSSTISGISRRLSEIENSGESAAKRRL